MRYFRKELPESPVYINGFPLRFDILSTEDPKLVAELDRCVARGAGGVMMISKEEYDETFKKKETETQYGSNSKPHRQELKSSLQPLDARRVAEAVANPANSRQGMFARAQRDSRPNPRQEPMPEPIQIPSVAQFALPPTARVNEAK